MISFYRCEFWKNGQEDRKKHADKFFSREEIITACQEEIAADTLDHNFREDEDGTIRVTADTTNYIYTPIHS